MAYKPGEKGGGENQKYGPLRWELKQKYWGYEVKLYNIIMDVSEVKLKEMVGSKSKGVLYNMQKALLSGTINIS